MLGQYLHVPQNLKFSTIGLDQEDDSYKEMQWNHIMPWNLYCEHGGHMSEEGQPITFYWSDMQDLY